MDVMELKQFVRHFLMVFALQFCFFFFANGASGTTQTDSIFYYIYNQEFKQAERSLQKDRSNLPPNLYHLYETDLRWWKTLSQPQPNNFLGLEAFLQQQLKRLENHSFNPGIAELITLNYLMRLKAIQNQPFKLFTYYLRIQKLINNFDQSLLSPEERSMYEIYTAVFNVGKSKLLMNVKLRDDSIEQIKKHQDSSQTNIQTIAFYFLAKIYIDIEKSPRQAAFYYSRLCARYPNNAIFRNDLRLCL
jgi:hypothetical protein